MLYFCQKFNHKIINRAAMISTEKKKAVVPNDKTLPKRISWAAFQADYLQREDGFNYEWVNGAVEKTPRSMNRKQFYIIQNLVDFFGQLKYSGKITGSLIPEGDTFFGENHRRPDVAYYTDEQIESAAEDNDAEPQFIIEIISTTDEMNRVHRKMKDYRASEIPVIWHIFPELHEVHVFHGRKSEIFVGEEICSADPVLPEFKMSVNAIFKRQVKV
jgi:Uma2 family endonuclease